MRCSASAILTGSTTPSRVSGTTKPSSRSSSVTSPASPVAASPSLESPSPESEAPAMSFLRDLSSYALGPPRPARPPPPTLPHLLQAAASGFSASSAFSSASIASTFFSSRAKHPEPGAHRGFPLSQHQRIGIGEAPRIVPRPVP